MLPAIADNANTIVSKKGKVMGHRYFMGSLSAKDIRAAGKAQGLKGSALNEYVNTSLRDETANRQASVAVIVTGLHANGYVGDTSEVRSKSAVIRFTKASPDKVESAKDREIARLQAELEQLRKVQAVMALPVVG